MNRAFRAAARRWRCGHALLSALAAIFPAAAKADLWSLTSSVQANLETNDNVNLVPQSPGTVNTLSLSTDLNASRRVENAATALTMNLASLRQQGPGSGDRLDGRLGLTQSITFPRGSLNAAATLAQDFNSDLLTADVTVGRGQRRTASLSGGGSYALTERLSASAQLSAGRAGYGSEVTRASDFRTTGASGSLNYLVSEVDTLALQAGHSGYHTLTDSNRYRTDSLSVGLSRAWSERTTISLDLGAYRTERSREASRLACPLPISFCRGGLVPLQVVRERLGSTQTGLDYNASLRTQFDETTALALGLGRQKTTLSLSRQFSERNSASVGYTRQQQVPSGSGDEVRGRSFTASASFGVAPDSNVSLNYTQSRSSQLSQGSDSGPQQSSFAASINKEFTRDLSLQAGFRRALAENLGSGTRAHANSVNIALVVTWARFEASR